MKNEERLIAKISATRKQNQTFSSFPLRERKYATGSKTTSCLTKETVMLKKKIFLKPEKLNLV